MTCLAIEIAPAGAAEPPRSAARTRSQPEPRTGTPYGRRADVMAFAAEVADEQGTDREDVERWLASARFQPQIVTLMSRPLLEPPKWFEYVPPFTSRARIEAGLAYWQAHEEVLAAAEAAYGVPPEIVIGILGVETFYGRMSGSHRVIDALATLAFDYPRRAAFFRGELKEFLKLAREQGISPMVPKGSFAGAMGLPQFMPGSYRRYAVDFDGDGRIDLWESDDDAIGSVAYYLARHDWERGQPVLLRASIAPDQLSTALRKLDGGISERRPMAAWDEEGISTSEAPADLGASPVGLLMLEESPADASYWIACNNFYVITRYNRSRLYASAVWTLAQAVKAAKAASK